MWLNPADVIELWIRGLGRVSFYGGLAIAGAWLICRCLPRMTPAVRSWIWRLVYLKLLLLALWPDSIQFPVLAEPSIRLEPVKGSSRTAAREPPVPIGFDNPAGRQWLASEPVRGTPGFFPVLLFVLWLSAILGRSIRTIHSVLATRRTLREGCRVTDAQPGRQCAELSRYLGLDRTPELLCHSTVSVPQVVGLLRPRLLFPAAFFDRFSLQEFRLVIAHELAHIRRKDLAWAWVQRLVNGVLFFHPLVWVAREQAMLADEIACDETAVRAVQASASEYAGTLLCVAEENLRLCSGSPALRGAGMSRAYRVMARRLQALRAGWSIGFSRSKRWRATLVACLAAALLFPLGLMTLFGNSGIRQIDPRYRVLGYKVSRGRNHSLAVTREVCRFAGVEISRAIEDAKSPLGSGEGQRSSPLNRRPGSANPAAGSKVSRAGMPIRVAGWLRQVGLKPRLDTGSYASQVFGSENSCAIIVRFAHNPRLSGYADIIADLVDEQGERVPLVTHSAETPPGSGEHVKFWMISPPPLTRAKFDLHLRLPDENKEVAVIRLGEL